MIHHSCIVGFEMGRKRNAAISKDVAGISAYDNRLRSNPHVCIQKLQAGLEVALRSLLIRVAAIRHTDGINRMD